MSKIAIGVDLGGTRIKTVAVDGHGGLLYQEYTPTNDGYENWKQTIQGSIEQAKEKLGLSNFVVGISAPGIPDQNNSVIEFMPGRLHGLEAFDWSNFLSRKTWVLNDAVAALMAESTLGSAKNRKNAVMLTLGTGVGGAILIDGKPYQGNFQKAGHIGHISLNCEDPADITGMPGSLEDAIGNCTIQKRSLGQYKDTHSLLEAYRAGDHFAKWVWLASVRKLAIAIASISNMISPECVILGGGITEAGADLAEPLERFLSLYEWRPGGNKVEIVKAQFNDMAGAIGAACFASVQA
ncbi:MAG: ROK family protein [Chitinophagaceae bacterium]|nr:ROK family protein [Chitinophagaceae bacterium]